MNKIFRPRFTCDIECIPLKLILHKDLNKLGNINIGSFKKEITYLLLFDLILYVPSTNFQLNRDGSSWVEPVLS